MNMFWPDVLAGPSSPRRRAFYLIFAALVMLAASWAVASMAGVPVAILAGLFGWLACWIMRPAPATALPSAVAPSVVAASSEPTVVAASSEPTVVAASSEPDALAVLRHDVRGMLSPALMVADRLVAHDDPVVARAGDVIARTVQRVTDRLDETKS